MCEPIVNETIAYTMYGCIGTKHTYRTVHIQPPSCSQQIASSRRHIKFPAAALEGHATRGGCSVFWPAELHAHRSDLRHRVRRQNIPPNVQSAQEKTEYGTRSLGAALGLRDCAPSSRHDRPNPPPALKGGTYVASGPQTLAVTCSKASI